MVDELIEELSSSESRRGNLWEQLLDSGCKTMLQQEQKIMNSKQRHNMQVHKPGDLVPDACCGTDATIREFLPLQQHLGFVGC